MRIESINTAFATFCLSVLFASSCFAEAFDPKLHEQIQPKSPEESLKTMVVQDGYSIELVAAEPMVEEPVLFAFDGNGRLYVAEMLTYMQDADGSGKFEKTSRIKRLEDTDGDGTMDRFTIFADKLLLPRMVLPLDDGRILVRETNTLDLLLMADTNGDGKADKTTVVYEGGGRGGNLEHQPSGLIYGIDNWLYVTYTDKRYKFTDDKVIAQELPWGGGQWGVGQDHVGRMYYSTAGGQNPAMNFQAPSVYGYVGVEGEQAPGFREVFPLDKTPDVQGGLPLLRDDNTLNHFTGGGGQSIYLGGLFPDMEGDYIITEPVGNLIRRAEVIRKEGYSVLENTYQKQKKEFIASTDANFRPVWTDTAPDGSLMILDMYRGIIQEGNWTQKGSYLRDVIDQYGFDRIIGRGRLFRVTKNGTQLYKTPRMFDESPKQLLQHLSHKNAWWRLQAQKLIVLAQDKSVIPQLKKMASEHKNPLAKIHAMWTLEGLGIIDTGILFKNLNSDNSDVRMTAIRLSEQLFKENESEITQQWMKLASDADIEIVQQVILSAYQVFSKDRNKFTQLAQKKHGKTRGLVAIEKSMKGLETLVERRKKLAAGNAELATAVIEGEKIYKTLCYTCHGEKGEGTAAGSAMLAPGFIGNPRINGNITLLTNALLHGMVGPIDGKNYAAGSMQPLASNSDEWLANILTYLRNSFNNSASLVTPAQVKTIRALNAKRNKPWTQKELETYFDAFLPEQNKWRVTTSFPIHKRFALENILIPTDQGKIFSARTARANGDTITIALPRSAMLTELVIDSRGLNNFYSRAYEIEISSDGKSWEKVVKNLTGSMYDENQLLGKTAQYVRVINLAPHNRRQWRINEIKMRGRYL